MNQEETFFFFLERERERESRALYSFHPSLYSFWPHSRLPPVHFTHRNNCVIMTFKASVHHLRVLEIKETCSVCLANLYLNFGQGEKKPPTTHPLFFSILSGSLTAHPFFFPFYTPHMKSMASSSSFVVAAIFSLCFLSCAFAELQRFEHAPKSDGSLSFLVVGDWGRRGDYNQSQVATQVGIGFSIFSWSTHLN